MTVQTQRVIPQRRTLSMVQQPAAALDRVARFWNSGSAAPRQAALVFWLLLGAICAIRAYIGLSGVRAFSHDGFLVLDGAWRMVNGQRPHVDFNSMVGPLAYLPTVLGFQLCGDTAAGFGYGQAIVAFVLGAWAFVLGRDLAPVPRAVFALSVAAIAGSPAQIGPSPFELSPGMTYNRYTYALLGVVMLECVRERRQGEFYAGLSSGIALGLMTFLKMTGVVIEVVLLLGLLPMRPQTWRRWGGLASGFVIVALPLLVYLHFDLGQVWRDLQLTAAAKHMVVYDRFDFGSLFIEAALTLLVTVEVVYLLGERDRGTEARRLFWAMGVVIFASLGLILGNYQRASMPLLTLMLVVVLDHVVQYLPASREHGSVRSMAVAGASILIGTLGLSLAASLFAGVALKVFTVPHRPGFHAPALRSFVPVGEEIAYTHWANEGFDLLAAHRRPGERVMSLDFTNPFSFGLHIPPAPGGTTNLQFHGSFDDQHKVSPERLFGGAELVMLPRSYSDPTLYSSIPLNYGPYLHQHYGLIGQTEAWQLYRRLP